MINATEIIFDGVSSAFFSLIVTTTTVGGGISNTPSPQIDIGAEQVGNTGKWKSYGSKYTEPISFTIELVRKDGATMPADEISKVARWFVRKNDYKWLSFVQTDYADIFFRARATGYQIMSVGNMNKGISISYTTDSAFGHSQLITTTFVIEQGQESSVVVSSSEEGYIYPQMIITIPYSGTFEIVNNTDNATRSFKIANCSAGEIITVDNENKIILSSLPNHKIYDDFNFNFFRLVSKLNIASPNSFYTSNSLTQKNGKGMFTLTYRCPKKITY